MGGSGGIEWGGLLFQPWGGVGAAKFLAGNCCCVAVSAVEGQAFEKIEGC